MSAIMPPVGGTQTHENRLEHVVVWQGPRAGLTPILKLVLRARVSAWRNGIARIQTCRPYAFPGVRST